MKKVLVFTGTRADYGLLYPLIKTLKSEKEFKVEILVSGTHLSEKFGCSYKEIENDNFNIDWKADLNISGDSVQDITESMALGLKQYVDILLKAVPHIAIVLGDRYEALAFAIACQICRIPLAHIHGGEITEGAIDDAFRHSITKLSCLHFASAKIYAERIIQLGEAPDRVFNTGALGVDNIHNIKILSRDELSDKFGFNFKRYNFLVTFHPETLSDISSEQQIAGLLSALDRLKTYLKDDCSFIFTIM